MTGSLCIVKTILSDDKLNWWLVKLNFISQKDYSLKCDQTDQEIYIGFLRPGFFHCNTLGYALGVLTPKASPSGWVFSQAQQPMFKTYNTVDCVITTENWE